ncbi:MAG: GntR family transcriptional regulator, transcriptional repressor for pyruvate dehydrogenase complex [Solirubrobacteraceae bacterium]
MNPSISVIASRRGIGWLNRAVRASTEKILLQIDAFVSRSVTKLVIRSRGVSRLHQQLMRTLLADITSGDLPPGGAALRETDIAGRFGVSRGVARECVRGLEERGLVSVKPGLGATVTSPDRWAVFDPDVLSALLGARRGGDLLGAYVECRRILEVAAVGLAAERAGEQDLTVLSNALERMAIGAGRAAVDLAAEERFHDADLAFHEALIGAAHNAALTAMLAPLWQALGAARRALGGGAAGLERSLTEHRRILTAVVRRDPDEARAAMDDHLLGVERELHHPPDGHANLLSDDEHRA